MATRKAGDSNQRPGEDQEPRDYERAFVRTFTGVLWLTTISLCLYVGVTIVAFLDGRALPGDGLGTLVVMVVAIFGVLVTGLFVFMTFRIDRGAKLEAGDVASITATEVAAKIAEDAKEIARKQATDTAKRSVAQHVSREAGPALQRAVDERLDKIVDDAVEAFRRRRGDG